MYIEAVVDIIFFHRVWNFAFRKAIRVGVGDIGFKTGFHSFVRASLFLVGFYSYSVDLSGSKLEGRICLIGLKL